MPFLYISQAAHPPFTVNSKYCEMDDKCRAHQHPVTKHCVQPQAPPSIISLQKAAQSQSTLCDPGGITPKPSRVCWWQIRTCPCMGAALGKLLLSFFFFFLNSSFERGFEIKSWERKRRADRRQKSRNDSGMKGCKEQHKLRAWVCLNRKHA